MSQSEHFAEVYYPESDGQPMESDLHRDLMVDLIKALQAHFRDDPRVYVSGNLFIYYEEGNPQRSVGPDVFVVRGVPNHRRPLFKLWEEAAGPCLVIEISSKSTHRDDLGRKREIYERLGVKEYYIFDPDGFHEGPPLKAFRAIAGELRSIDVEIAKGCARAFSPILGLDLQVDGDVVRLIDPETGEALPFLSEMSAVLLSERDRADAEKARAEAESQRADAEKARAEAAEAEVARLREELERRRGAD